jgi:integrase
VLLGLRTGLRLNSMLSLRVGDVAVGGRVRDRIRVRRSTVKGRRAGFDMPLHPQARVALQALLETLEDHSAQAFLFPGRRSGTRLCRAQGWRLIKAVFEESGLVGARGELGAHVLRKTFARLIYAELQNDLVRTSRAMRHASVETTIEYLSFEDGEVDTAILNVR